MNGLDLRMHVLAIVALGVNLWVGGDLIERWLGGGARTAFELLLILAYMLVVLGMRAPLRLRFWRRSDAQEDEQE
jgi:hypothetical protein